MPGLGFRSLARRMSLYRLLVLCILALAASRAVSVVAHSTALVVLAVTLVGFGAGISNSLLPRCAPAARHRTDARRSGSLLQPPHQPRRRGHRRARPRPVERHGGSLQLGAAPHADVHLRCGADAGTVAPVVSGLLYDNIGDGAPAALSCVVTLATLPFLLAPGLRETAVRDGKGLQKEL
jgi:hypothetical protein